VSFLFHKGAETPVFNKKGRKRRERFQRIQEQSFIRKAVRRAQVMKELRSIDVDKMKVAELKQLVRDIVKLT